MLLLTIILEIMNIVDIATTEYMVERRKLSKEMNPLAKNTIIRRGIVYPVKMSAPIIMEWAGSKTEQLGKLVFYAQIGLLPLYAIVLSNNIYGLLKGFNYGKRS